MRGAERQSLLFAGFSLGELLTAMLLLAAITSSALSYVPAAAVHAAQAEVLGITTDARLYWIERWANDGVSDTAPPAVSPIDGRYAESIDDVQGDGTLSFIFKGTMPPLEGGVVTFRPAFPADGAGHAVIWVCGHAAAPRGFAVRGENHTSIAPKDLIARCRGPLS
jgi:type IV pilus assembly protein PilA